MDDESVAEIKTECATRNLAVAQYILSALTVGAETMNFGDMDYNDLHVQVVEDGKVTSEIFVGASLT